MLTPPPPPTRPAAAPANPLTTSARRPGARRPETLAWALWALVLLGVLTRAGLHPGRNSVFRLFRQAGARWLAGERLYPNVGEFLYSPLAAAAFSPFARLPEGMGGVLWRSGNAAALLAAVAALPRRPWAGGAGQAAGLTALLALSLGNLNNGQATPLVLALLLGATLAADAGRWSLAAAAVAGATFFKIYPLAFGLLLAALHPRQLSWRLVLALAGAFALSLLLGGTEYTLAQYRAWFASLGADPRRTDGPFGTWRDAWLLLRLARVPIGVSQYAVLQVAAGAAAAAFCVWGQRARGWVRGRSAFAAFGLGCAWVTLFGPSTESATFVFLAPALALGVAAAVDNPAGMPTGARAALGAALGLLIASETLGAWVPAVRRSVLAHALQPLGALCFVFFLVVWIRRDAAWAPGRVSPGVHPGPAVPPRPR